MAREPAHCDYKQLHRLHRPDPLLRGSHRTLPHRLVLSQKFERTDFHEQVQLIPGGNQELKPEVYQISSRDCNGILLASFFPEPDTCVLARVPLGIDRLTIHDLHLLDHNDSMGIATQV